MKKQMENRKTYIIGGGVSGLVAARVLENNGFEPIIIEATDRVGGRVKTDVKKGYQLDHGFQVLLTSYPMAQKYLDLEALDLQRFLPGASIFRSGKQKIIGDPLRDVSLIFSTLFSGIGTTLDKIKILKLNAYLKKKSIEAIFEEKETSTLDYLRKFGFSQSIINEFFTPFFSGIFLETALSTSSRMFEFVYKMFGEGYAAVPKAGIEAIPAQLKQKLTKTTYLFNTKVREVKNGEIKLENGEVLQSNSIIVATDPTKLISNLAGQSTKWKSCVTLYFETESRNIKKPLIGLVADKESLVNNIFFHTSLESDSKGKKELLSVTVIDTKGKPESEIIERMQRELKQYCGIQEVEYLAHYDIPMALPDLINLRYDMLPSETQLTSDIFLAGDTQLNGSLNAAMVAGERAALAVIEKLR